ncbi:hypothetical protein SDC9_115238 [bioreactor metagenome]|uniref:Uncharacterized protein n=1 Tax=bioreactor metagenome TaxID=1076179 RepID=A0A645BSV6_9ZZZZ
MFSHACVIQLCLKASTMRTIPFGNSTIRTVSIIQSLLEKSIKKSNFFFGGIRADPEELHAFAAAIFVDRRPRKKVPIRRRIQRLQQLTLAKCDKAHHLIRLHYTRAEVFVVLADGAKRGKANAVDAKHGLRVALAIRRKQTKLLNPRATEFAQLHRLIICKRGIKILRAVAAFDMPLKRKTELLVALFGNGHARRARMPAKADKHLRKRAEVFKKVNPCNAAAGTG